MDHLPLPYVLVEVPEGLDADEAGPTRLRSLGREDAWSIFSGMTGAADSMGRCASAVLPRSALSTARAAAASTSRASCARATTPVATVSVASALRWSPSRSSSSAPVAPARTWRPRSPTRAPRWSSRSRADRSDRTPGLIRVEAHGPALVSIGAGPERRTAWMR